MMVRGGEGTGLLFDVEDEEGTLEEDTGLTIVEGGTVLVESEVD